MCARKTGLFLDHFTQLAKACDDPAVILAAVRDEAAGAVLDALFVVAEIAAAARPEGVERAVAEQAAEFFGMLRLVAGEKLAVGVLKKGCLLYTSPSPRDA